MNRIIPEKRSRLMKRVKLEDMTSGIRIRSALHCAGYRFRLHAKEFSGRFGIDLPKCKMIILVYGCFWHRHKGCSEASMSSTNQEYWKKKIQQNVERDKREQSELKKLDWKEFVIGACQIVDLDINFLGNLTSR